MGRPTRPCSAFQGKRGRVAEDDQSVSLPSRNAGGALPRGPRLDQGALRPRRTRPPAFPDRSRQRFRPRSIVWNRRRPTTRRMRSCAMLCASDGRMDTASGRDSRRGCGCRSADTAAPVRSGSTPPDSGPRMWMATRGRSGDASLRRRARAEASGVKRMAVAAAGLFARPRRSR